MRLLLLIFIVACQSRPLILRPKFTPLKKAGQEKSLEEKLSILEKSDLDFSEEIALLKARLAFRQGDAQRTRRWLVSYREAFISEAFLDEAKKLWLANLLKQTPRISFVELQERSRKFWGKGAGEYKSLISLFGDNAYLEEDIIEAYLQWGFQGQIKEVLSQEEFWPQELAAMHLALNRSHGFENLLGDRGQRLLALAFYYFQKKDIAQATKFFDLYTKEKHLPRGSLQEWHVREHRQLIRRYNEFDYPERILRGYQEMAHSLNRRSGDSEFMESIGNVRKLEAELQLKIASYHWQLGRPDRAEKIYRALLKWLEKNSFEESEEIQFAAIDSLARRIYFEQHSLDKSIQFLEESEKSLDQNSKWWSHIRFLNAFYRHLAGDFKGSLDQLNSLEAATHTESLQEAVFYWKAANLKALKREQEAKVWLEKLVEEFPMSFYSWASINAQKSLQDRIVFADSPPSFEFLRPKSWDGSKAELLAQKVETLLKLGLSELAQKSSLELAKKFGATQDEVKYSRYLAHLFSASELFLKSLVEMRRSQEIPMSREDWKIAYPRPYLEAFLQESKKYNLEPSFMMAMARQESAFTEEIVSESFGYGLMQIQEKTGQKIAKDLKIKIDREDLLSAPKSIAYSAYFTDKISKIVGRNPVFLSAAYNAGEGRVQLWKKARYKNQRFDAFAENIPLAVTRNHAKNVYKNWAIYDFLYR